MSGLSQRILVHTLLDILARIDPQNPCDQINLATAGLLKDPKRCREVLAACGVDIDSASTNQEQPQ